MNNKPTDFSWRFLQDSAAERLAADLFNVQQPLKKILMPPGKEIALVIYKDRFGFEERQGDEYVRMVSVDMGVIVKKLFNFMRGEACE